MLRQMFCFGVGGSKESQIILQPLSFDISARSRVSHTFSDTVYMQSHLVPTLTFPE